MLATEEFEIAKMTFKSDSRSSELLEPFDRLLSLPISVMRYVNVT